MRMLAFRFLKRDRRGPKYKTTPQFLIHVQFVEASRLPPAHAHRCQSTAFGTQRLYRQYNPRSRTRKESNRRIGTAGWLENEDGERFRKLYNPGRTKWSMDTHWKERGADAGDEREANVIGTTERRTRKENKERVSRERVQNLTLNERAAGTCTHSRSMSRTAWASP